MTRELKFRICYEGDTVVLGSETGGITYENPELLEGEK